MLDRLQPRAGSRRERLRKGRGPGSGKGRTAGRGQKGAGARSGFKQRPWYEGGQMPLARRLPKRGFHNPTREQNQVVNVKQLERFDAGSAVDAQVLVEAGLIRDAAGPVKLLAEGEITRALVLRVTRASAAARKKVEAAGGSVEIVPGKQAKPGARAEAGKGAAKS